MANALKFIITGIPLLVFVIWCASPEKFKETLVRIDSVQGPQGWVQLQTANGTVGQKFEKFLNGMAPNASPEVKVYFQSFSGELDRITYFLEKYWVWCAAGLLFLICVVVILRAKDYK